MATLLSAIITSARRPLLESTASFWTDAELLEHATNGIKALWKDIIDLGKDHFLTIDATNVAAAASTAALTGIPTDMFRVVALQPRTLGASAENNSLVFKPRETNHPDFVTSEAMGAVEPRGRVIYYAVINAGAPVAAPAIHIAPQVSAAVLLTLKYIPTIGTLTSGSTNPIPGESDKAVEAYTVAFARAKEREDRSPDPEWLSIYATEARKILTALTPRSIQEPEYVVGMWEHDQGLVE